MQIISFPYFLMFSFSFIVITLSYMFLISRLPANAYSFGKCTVV